MKNYKIAEAIVPICLLVAMFFVGRYIAGSVHDAREASGLAFQTENW